MYILFFSLSVLFAWQVESLQNNFTYFSYTAPYQMLYFIWLNSLGGFVYIHLYPLAKQVSKKTKWVCHVAMLLFVLGGNIPYQPDTQDIYSTLHVLFSMVSIILVVWIIYRYMQSILQTNHTLYQKLHSIIQIGLLYFIPICFINGNINIIVELYCLGWILYLLYIVEKSQKALPAPESVK